MEELADRRGNCSGNLSGIPIYPAAGVALCNCGHCFGILLSVIAEMVERPGNLERTEKAVGVSAGGCPALFYFALPALLSGGLSVPAGTEHFSQFSLLSGKGCVPV